VIPTIVSQLAAGRVEVDLGDTTPTRDFNYVLDTCEGLCQLASCDAAVGEVVNIGSNFEISVGDLFERIRAETKSDATLRRDEQRLRPEKSEVRRLWCDNAKIKRLTGFAPAYTLERGLRATIDWFTEPANLKLYKAGTYNV
jgi:nucleoside-diphosphate-sugar epimerase